MDRITQSFALTGDAEIDEVCPSHPRVLDEVAVVVVDSTRLMLVGGLGAPMLARRLGALDVLAFLSELDGTRALEQLCAAHLPAAPERKRLLYLLLRHGLLEQPAAPAPVAVRAETVRYLAKRMDQTRIHNRRPDVVAAFLRPVGMLGAAHFRHQLTLTLRQAGLTVCDHAPGMPAHALTIAILDEATPPDAWIDRLQGDNAAVLLVCPRGPALDVGPLLTSRGSCTTACYRASCDGLGYEDDPATRPAWLAIVSNVVVLLNSSTSPLSLVNNLIRYQLHDGQMRTTAFPVPRRNAIGATPIALAVPDSPGLLPRLERHSRIAVPPRRLVGVKHHDVHYAGHHVAAAKQLPLPHGDAGKVISMANATPSQRLLLQLLIRSFGYWTDAHGDQRRICPSGGNLGAAEGMVVWHDPARRRTILLRYVPVVDWLEPVADAPMTEAAGVDEYDIVCLVNVEKARQKYFDFGCNLAYLDGGVGAAFLQASAQAAGLPLAFRYGDVAPDWIGDLLDHRRHYYGYAWRAGLPSIATAPVQWDQFDSLLRRRRAARHCTRLDLAAPRIATLLGQARPRPDDGAESALLSCLRPILVLEQAGRCATYEWLADGALRLCPGSTIAADAPGQELLSQRNLSRAAGRLFMLADVPLVLTTQGTGGHDRLLTLTGQWIGAFWLAIEREGLHGCPAGAAIESDLLSHLPTAYAHLFSVFAFTFGNTGEAPPCSD
ncbi:hypothetical protein JOD97_000536 [Duganella sp. 1411]|uniref:hypothetical protein n=1 Tax=Duganella sp. 1411 TaxID=2806572 RepID=UPI001AE5CB01|nr:hypothetical protein [Duganella sp. 1411]MBP1202522.1 hypothetical protein [Duganella sp. 1411]